MLGISAAGLAFPNGDPIEWKDRTEIYHLVLSAVPPDILSAAAGRLIASEEFFPTAARWLKECDRPWGERQRMRRRISALASENREAEGNRRFMPESMHVRLAGMIATYRRHPERYAGQIAAHQKTLWDLAVHTRYACQKTGEPVPPWSTGEEAITISLQDGEHRVFVEPPPENPPPAQPLPFGIREPVVVPPELRRTPAEQQAIDDTKAGLQAVQGMVEDYGEYGNDEPAGDE